MSKNMTKKDFEMIAGVISDVRNDHRNVQASEAMSDLVKRLTLNMKADNPQFRVDLFNQMACAPLRVLKR